jgi:hypothetical protein
LRGVRRDLHRTFDLPERQVPVTSCGSRLVERLSRDAPYVIVA